MLYAKSIQKRIHMFLAYVTRKAPTISSILWLDMLWLYSHSLCDQQNLLKLAHFPIDNKRSKSPSAIHRLFRIRLCPMLILSQPAFVKGPRTSQLCTFDHCPHCMCHELHASISSRNTCPKHIIDMPEDTEKKAAQKKIKCRKIQKCPRAQRDNLKLNPQRLWPNENFLAGMFSPCCSDMEFPQQIYNMNACGSTIVKFLDQKF